MTSLGTPFMPRRKRPALVAGQQLDWNLPIFFFFFCQRLQPALQRAPSDRGHRDMAIALADLTLTRAGNQAEA